MSEMTDRKANRIITEAMGLVWHEITLYHESNTPYCLTCDIVYSKCPSSGRDAKKLRPTASASDYLEAMAWAKKQKWWHRFVNRIYLNNGMSMVATAEILLDPKLGSHALVKYITEEVKP